ncbi:unnamed protein product, partial [Closterium sp. Yama58-4]
MLVIWSLRNASRSDLEAIGRLRPRRDKFRNLIVLLSVLCIFDAFPAAISLSDVAIGSPDPIPEVPAVSDWDAFETQLRREADDDDPIIEVNATTLNRLFELLTASNPTALTSPSASPSSTPSSTPSSSFHSTTPSPSLPFPHSHTSPSPPTSTRSASESKQTPSDLTHTCPGQTGHQGKCDSGGNTVTSSSRSSVGRRASAVCRAACVLVYTDWCPFSSQLRALLSTTAPLFPHILHVAIDKKELRPSVLSRMGVYSVPALFLQNSTTRIRYRGPRTAAHLSEYISAFTR